MHSTWGPASRLFHTVYDTLCGRPPAIRPWHFQWLATKDLYRELGALAPHLTGRILDVGCGHKPYRRWFTGASDYVGMNWVDVRLSRTWLTKMIKVALLPLWIVVSATVNGAGALVDVAGDRSGTYVNVLAVFAKPDQRGPV